MAEIVVVEKRPTVIVNPSGSQVLVTGPRTDVVVSEEGVQGPAGDPAGDIDLGTFN